MKYYTLICLLFTIVNVYSSPYSPPTIKGAGEPALPKSIKVSKQQLEQLSSVFTISDELLALKDKNQCLEKLLCLLETDSSDEANNSLTTLSKYLTNKGQVIDDDSFEDVQKLLHYYPHLESLVSAVKLGQDPETCINAFADCHISKEILLVGAKELGALVTNVEMHEKPNEGFDLQYTMASRRLRRDLTPEQEVTAICTTAAITCGGYGTWCVFCTILSLGACGPMCGPVAGVICSGTGIGCGVKDLR